MHGQNHIKSVIYCRWNLKCHTVKIYFEILAKSPYRNRWPFYAVLLETDVVTGDDFRLLE